VLVWETVKAVGVGTVVVTGVTPTHSQAEEYLTEPEQAEA
jgi:hypothetical protein